MGRLTVLLFAFLLAFSSCHNNKPDEAKNDKEYEKYLEYKDIFNSYRKVPLDTTRIKLEDFLQHFPENVQARVFYARVLYDLNRGNDAMAQYRRAINDNARYPEAYSGLGALYRINGQTDSAAFYLEKAITLKDSSALTYLNLSAVYFMQNKTQQCIAYADTALQKADSSVVIYSGLSLLYHKLGKEEGSRKFFAQALAVGLKDSAAFEMVLAGTLKPEEYYRNNNY